jgi:hypothetical protein
MEDEMEKIKKLVREFVAPPYKRFEVWYAREPTFEFSEIKNLGDFLTKYTKVADVWVKGKKPLEKIFIKMQGENWSSGGEARDFIKRSGLTHTSMSVGDVIIDSEGRVWGVDEVGFRPLSFPPFENDEIKKMLKKCRELKTAENIVSCERKIAEVL